MRPIEPVTLPAAAGMPPHVAQVPIAMRGGGAGREGDHPVGHAHGLIGPAALPAAREVAPVPIAAR